MDFTDTKFRFVIGSVKLGSLLGSGRFSDVFEVQDYPELAVKVSRRTWNRDLGYLLREIAALRVLKHPNLPPLRAVCFRPTRDHDYKVYLVLPRASCSVRSWWNQEHTDYFIPKSKSILITDAQFETKLVSTAWQIARGVAYLHRMNYMHRDLKPDNLLVYKASRALIRIADFGTARYGVATDASSEYTFPIITASYRPPELLEHSHDSKLETLNYHFSADMWSLGVILAELASSQPFLEITNSTPISEYYTICMSHFDASGQLNEAKREIFKILDSKDNYPWINVEFLNLVIGLLNLDPKKRLTAQEVLDHDYFKRYPILIAELKSLYPVPDPTPIPQVIHVWDTKIQIHLKSEDRDKIVAAVGNVCVSLISQRLGLILSVAIQTADQYLATTKSILKPGDLAVLYLNAIFIANLLFNTQDLYIDDMLAAFLKLPEPYLNKDLDITAIDRMTLDLLRNLDFDFNRTTLSGQVRIYITEVRDCNKLVDLVVFCVLKSSSLMFGYSIPTLALATAWIIEQIINRPVGRVTRNLDNFTLLDLITSVVFYSSQEANLGYAAQAELIRLNCGRDIQLRQSGLPAAWILPYRL